MNHLPNHPPATPQIRLLRSMLEWGRELGSSIAAEATAEAPAADAAAIAAWTEAQLAAAPPRGGAGADVLVLVWPGGRILRVPRGTTAGAGRGSSWPGGLTDCTCRCCTGASNWQRFGPL